MSGMGELIAFVGLCLDEEEDLARVAAALTRSPWTSEGSTVMCSDGMVVARVQDGERATAEHIALNDPARVLAEVEAKRQIIEECDSGITGWTDPGEKDRCRDILRLLAQPFAGHPGWREEWRT